MPNARLLPYLLITIAGLMWGGTFTLALIATADGAPALTLTAWQVLVSAVLFALGCLITGKRTFVFKHIDKYLVIAFLGVIVPDLLYYNAAPHLSAGILSVTVSTVPVFTYAIMWVFGYESLVIKRALGIVLGMIAILLLVIPGQGLSASNASFWIALVIICAVLYAAENVFISEGISDDMPILELLCGSTVVASVLLVPATIWFGAEVPIGWIFTKAAWAVTATALISVFAYALFFHSIKIAGPVFASQCAYIVTLSGVLWGIAIFAEEHSIWVWISIAVMMAGIALVTPSERMTEKND
ncbi:MAG: drug/metabolite transporter (DMT)-like permease [Gammaproteobacteria bacterium]|jgi:drug/metabolite transporter (DMT)-like permease